MTQSSDVDAIGKALFEAIRSECERRHAEPDDATETWLRVRDEYDAKEPVGPFAWKAVKNTIRARRQKASREAARSSADEPDELENVKIEQATDRVFDDADELRRAVEALCLKAFSAHWGRDWGDDVERAAKAPADPVEAEARDVVRQLHEATEAVARFAQRHPNGGERAAAFLRVLPNRDPTIFAETGVKRQEWPPTDGRSWLAHEWSRRLPACLTGVVKPRSFSVGVTPHVPGTVQYYEPAMPTDIKAKELAVVAILAGIGGTFEPGLTATNVIETESATMKRALTRFRP